MKKIILLAAFTMLTLNLKADERHGSFGVLQETENVEGSVDKDGFYEPSLYFDMKNGKWSFGATYYGEYHNMDYSDMTRGDSLDRFELRGHYDIFDTEKYGLGMQVALRNYSWTRKDPITNDTRDTTSNRWLNLQPDWRVGIFDKLSYEGWLGYYTMFNDATGSGYSDREIETESGLVYKFNDTVSAKLNYYLDRGWDVGGQSVNSFNNQQIRGYLPVNLDLFSFGGSTVTPYFRQTVYNGADEHDTRLGLRLDQKLPGGFAVSLEYAYEMRNFEGAPDGADSFQKFHYTGVGLNYSF